MLSPKWAIEGRQRLFSWRQKRELTSAVQKGAGSMTPYHSQRAQNFLPSSQVGSQKTVPCLP